MGSVVFDVIIRNLSFVESVNLRQLKLSESDQKNLELYFFFAEREEWTLKLNKRQALGRGAAWCGEERQFVYRSLFSSQFQQRPLVIRLQVGCLVAKPIELANTVVTIQTLATGPTRYRLQLLDEATHTISLGQVELDIEMHERVNDLSIHLERPTWLLAANKAQRLECLVKVRNFKLWIDMEIVQCGEATPREWNMCRMLVPSSHLSFFESPDHPGCLQIVLPDLLLPLRNDPKSSSDSILHNVDLLGTFLRLTLVLEGEKDSHVLGALTLPLLYRYQHQHPSCFVDEDLCEDASALEDLGWCVVDSSANRMSVELKIQGGPKYMPMQGAVYVDGTVEDGMYAIGFPRVDQDPSVTFHSRVSSFSCSQTALEELEEMSRRSGSDLVRCMKQETDLLRLRNWVAFETGNASTQDETNSVLNTPNSRISTIQDGDRIRRWWSNVCNYPDINLIEQHQTKWVRKARRLLIEHEKNNTALTDFYLRIHKLESDYETNIRVLQKSLSGTFY